MKLLQAMRMALKSIISNKTRSMLTMLGVIIGVAAVIVLVSLVGGFSANMTASFESMGTNLITVNLTGRGGNMLVKPADMLELAEENAEVISHVSPQVNTSVTAKVGTDNLTTTVYGGSESFYLIRNYEMALGSFYNYIQIENRQQVCVLGYYVATELFPGINPLGETISLNGNKFEVVGVLAKKDTGEESSVDDVISVPYSSATQLSQQGSVSAYVFGARSKDTVDQAMTVIEDYLAEIFPSSDSYRVFNQAGALDSINELTSTLTLVLVGIAAISLLVGGIGIMNIMLVSVTERTREIGVRKSLGAKRRDIRRQFLIEAGTVSACGGVLGIVFGILLANLAAGLMDLTAAVPLNAVLIAFGVSVGIGVVFGYFPAAAAAKLNPIDALRHD
jgi:putative ABC transport system permease protein